jgi:hypothetical protein
VGVGVGVGVGAGVGVGFGEGDGVGGFCDPPDVPICTISIESTLTGPPTSTVIAIITSLTLMMIDPFNQGFERLVLPLTAITPLMRTRWTRT